MAIDIVSSYVQTHPLFNSLMNHVSLDHNDIALTDSDGDNWMDRLRRARTSIVEPCNISTYITYLFGYYDSGAIIYSISRSQCKEFPHIQHESHIVSIDFELYEDLPGFLIYYENHLVYIDLYLVPSYTI